MGHGRRVTVFRFAVAFGAVVGLLGLLNTALDRTSLGRFLTGRTPAEAEIETRNALQQVIQDLRGAGYTESRRCLAPLRPCFAALVGPPPTFRAPAATGFSIQNDLNGDGMIDAHERIGYFLKGSVLFRQNFALDREPRPLLTGVDTFTLSYEDRHGNALTIPVLSGGHRDIRMVRIDVVRRVYPSGWLSLGTASAHADVTLRNR